MPGWHHRLVAPDEDVLAVAPAFLRDIGLDVRVAPVPGPTVLPGIMISAGALVVDPGRLAHPGDLLHEAGHLAVMSPADRRRASGALAASPAEEMMAIAWSYAAALRLGLAPSVVFHDAGYRGGAGALVQNFAEGRYVGVPMLAWLGLTVDPGRAGGAEACPYPAMVTWVRA